VFVDIRTPRPTDTVGNGIRRVPIPTTTLTRVTDALATSTGTSAGTAAKLADLAERTTRAVDAQEEVAAAKQHPRRKKTARERIAALLDEGSFVELDAFAAHRSTRFGLDRRKTPGDGVVTGYGTIDGRQVCVYSQDFTVFGGSLGEVHGQKITKVMDLALRTGVPLIGVLDGGGARIQEGVAALTQFAEIFRRNVAASGVIPQISLILGPSAGGAVYSPALTDFVVMADGTSNMFITGPDVIRAVTGEDVGFEELGGGQTHNARSGVAHYLGADEDDAIDWVKALVGYLPSNNLSEPPVWEDDAHADLATTDEDLELDTLVPDSDSQPYDMHTVIGHVLDHGDFLEVQPLYAQNVIVGFGHVEGRPVGVVANQPQQMAGTLDINAAEKAARFVRTCDAFNIPVLTFVDVPGFLPGTDQEWNGIIRRGAKLIYAYAEATVPLVTVITRKAYGGAYIVMGSKQLGADVNLAWPTAQIAVMGAGGAVNILHRGALKKVAEDGGDVDAERARLTAEYEEALVNPYDAAERGYVDAVIRPSETRAQVVRALRALRTKRASLPAKKHGNIPL
jgi:propionyl-CoA carboxylase beta chain